jgi:phospholipid-binding lipoprotein MlaA
VELLRRDHDFSDEGTDEGRAFEDQVPLDEEDLDAEFLDNDLDFLDEETDDALLQVADPLGPWNRFMFQFNDKFYFLLVKPFATGYTTVVPGPARIGVQNFFSNLTIPVRFASCLLQGKGHAALTEFDRFLINTTAGTLGFGDPAKEHGKLPPSEEDLGQSLGTYGVGDGFYIVWPFLGPSTLRDSMGTIGDLFLNPVSYLPIGVSLGAGGERRLNEASFRTGDYESLIDAAIDPYDAIRDAYIQHRKTKVEE